MIGVHAAPIDEKYVRRRARRFLVVENIPAHHLLLPRVADVHRRARACEHVRDQLALDYLEHAVGLVDAKAKALGLGDDDGGGGAVCATRRAVGFRIHDTELHAGGAGGGAEEEEGEQKSQAGVPPPRHHHHSIYLEIGFRCFDRK